jgi:hypothetical protein
MAKKKDDTKEQPAEGLLVSAAKKVGKAAGKIAAAVEGAPADAAPAAPPAPPKPKAVKIPKLAKKNKPRLPRRQKKAQQKAAAKHAKQK